MGEKAKVYFTDFRTKIDQPLTEKLKALIKKAGIMDIDMEGKYVAIKMHFGELGNLAYIRPNYAKAVADVVKEKGGRPFLTDCNTLYPGSRKNALDHLDVKPRPIQTLGKIMLMPITGSLNVLGAFFEFLLREDAADAEFIDEPTEDQDEK